VVLILSSSSIVARLHIAGTGGKRTVRLDFLSFVVVAQAVSWKSRVPLFRLLVRKGVSRYQGHPPPLQGGELSSQLNIEFSQFRPVNSCIKRWQN
jgi:hypothetical protein